MKKAFILIIGFLFLATPFSFSQTKSLTIDDAVVGVWRELYPEHIRGLSIRPDSKEFTKIAKKELLLVSFDLKKEKTLLTLEELNTALKTTDKAECTYLPAFEWIDKDNLRFNDGNNVIDFNLTKKIVTNYFGLDESFENVDFCAANKMAAYTIENNLSVMGADGIAKQVSNEKDKGIVFGQTVSRNEFGIEKGTYWSPAGNFLAFYRKDETMVTDYPIVNANNRIAEPAPVKYCMAGMKSEEVTLGIYDVKTGK